MNWVLNLWNEDEQTSQKLGAKPQRGNIRVVSKETLSVPGDVRTTLSAFDGDGWVMLTDRVKNLQQGQEVPEGLILAAERVNGLKSLHIRQHETSWCAWTYECVLDEQSEGLLFTETLERIPQGQLLYEVAWTPDEEGVYRPSSSRLKQVKSEVG